MTRNDANTLLDAAKAGADVSARAITEALRVTGDIDAGTMVQIVVPAGAWERLGEPLLNRAGHFDGLMP